MDITKFFSHAQDHLAELAASRSPRQTARHEILALANAKRRRSQSNGRPNLTSRHIQQAVCIVRRNNLAEPALLELAGFNGTER